MSPKLPLSTVFAKTLLGWLAACLVLSAGPWARVAHADVAAEAAGLQPVFAGTPLPSAEPIDGNNFDQLANVAQWGKGSLNAVAFAPDGKHFVVGSMFGLAVYDTAAPDRAPRWLPFEAPFWYNTLSISQDGNYILLEGREDSQVRNLVHGRVVQPTAALRWFRRATTGSGHSELSVLSPDGARSFHGQLSYNPDDFNDDISIAEVYDTATRQPLYRLTDNLSDITMSERSNPEGCEVSYFSYCGNALMPVALSPYKAAFAPDSDTFAVIYRPPSLYNSARFSLLRTYAAADGQLLNMFGSSDQPVQDFAYAPDSQSLLVAFVNGSLQLWNLAEQSLTFGGQAFTAPIGGLTYTHDGKYLLLQGPDVLEIRRSRDGALWARYPAVTSALSPIDNLLALADAEGVITLRHVNTGEIVRQIQAHTDTLFALAFSPDGQLLASSSQDCTLRLWEVGTGKFLHLFEETIVNAYGESSTASRIFIHYLRFIPGTHTLIGFGSWGTMVSWNVHSGATQYVIESAPLDYYNGMMTLDPHFPGFFNLDVENNRFSINDQTYDLQTGQALGIYQPPTTLPQGCAAGGERSADGTLLITYGYDLHEGQLCVLDADDQSLLQTLDVIPEDGREYTGVSGLALSPDGAQLAVSLWGGMVNIYQVAP